eukprot:g4269.t1
MDEQELMKKKNRKRSGLMSLVDASPRALLGMVKETLTSLKKERSVLERALKNKQTFRIESFPGSIRKEIRYKMKEIQREDDAQKDCRDTRKKTHHTEKMGSSSQRSSTSFASHHGSQENPMVDTNFFPETERRWAFALQTVLEKALFAWRDISTAYNKLIKVRAEKYIIRYENEYNDRIGRLQDALMELRKLQMEYEKDDDSKETDEENGLIAEKKNTKGNIQSEPVQQSALIESGMQLADVLFQVAQNAENGSLAPKLTQHSDLFDVPTQVVDQNILNAVFIDARAFINQYGNPKKCRLLKDSIHFQAASEEIKISTGTSFGGDLIPLEARKVWSAVSRTENATERRLQSKEQKGRIEKQIQKRVDAPRENFIWDRVRNT